MESRAVEDGPALTGDEAGVGEVAVHAEEEGRRGGIFVKHFELRGPQRFGAQVLLQRLLLRVSRLVLGDALLHRLLQDATLELPDLKPLLPLRQMLLVLALALFLEDADGAGMDALHRRLALAGGCDDQGHQRHRRDLARRLFDVSKALNDHTCGRQGAEQHQLQGRLGVIQGLVDHRLEQVKGHVVEAAGNLVPEGHGHVQPSCAGLVAWGLAAAWMTCFDSIHFRTESVSQTMVRAVRRKQGGKVGSYCAALGFWMARRVDFFRPVRTMSSSKRRRGFSELPSETRSWPARSGTRRLRGTAWLGTESEPDFRGTAVT